MRSRRIAINDGEQIFSRSKLLMFTQNSAFVSANRNSSIEKRTIDVNSFGYQTRFDSQLLLVFNFIPASSIPDFHARTSKRSSMSAICRHTLDEKHYSPRCSNEVRGRSFRDKTDAFPQSFVASGADNGIPRILSSLEK